jgi:outer membrane protein OmpA-like peptidoglycan-associated protein
MKTLIICFSLLLASSGLYAQESDSLRCCDKNAPFHKSWESLYDSTATAVRTTWIANLPCDNWFFSLEGGLGWLGSENWRDVAIKDNLKLLGGFSVGRWFTPVWGLRFNAQAARLNGMGYVGSTWYIGQNHPNSFGEFSAQSYESQLVTPYDYSAFFEQYFQGDARTYRSGFLYDFTHVGFTTDFLLNLRNLTSKYDPNAVFNPVFYMGLGYAHTLREKQRTAVNSILTTYGLQLNFALCKHWEIYLDGETTYAPETFDRQSGGNCTFDMVVSAKLGLTYKFGNSDFVRRTPECDPATLHALHARINTLQQELADALAAHPAPAPATARPEDLPKIPIDSKTPNLKGRDGQFELEPVYFTLDSYVVRENQMVKIENAVAYLRDNPGKKLELAAYADVQTGNPAHNWTLSENRVNAVAKIMTTKYRVDKNRLILTYKGDTVQPYKVNENNRVVIFIK